GELISCVRQGDHADAAVAEPDLERDVVKAAPKALLDHSPTELSRQKQGQYGGQVADDRLRPAAVGQKVAHRKSGARRNKEDDVKRTGKAQQALDGSRCEGDEEHCYRHGSYREGKAEGSVVADDTVSCQKVKGVVNRSQGSTGNKPQSR